MKMLTAVLVLIFFLAGTTAVRAEPLPNTIVLVHGAFSDGSSWNKLVPYLRNEGFEVISVQNPLSSLEEDVAFTLRAIEEAKGQVTLVGHSWGGMVISVAGLHEKVSSLVYVAAIAPIENESIADILHEHYVKKEIPPAPGFANPEVSKAGFMKLSRKTVLDYFAPDIPKAEAELIYLNQGRLNSRVLQQTALKVAWREKPSHYVVTTQDQMLAPEVMRSLASRMKVKAARGVE